MALSGLGLAPAVSSASTLIRGFADDVWLADPGKSWVHKTEATGAKVASIEVDWTSVEPRAPKPGMHPSNPNDPQYNFGYLDTVVKKFAGSGIQTLFLVTDAPRWAEAKGGTKAQEASGGYEPNAKAFRLFAQALAKRYSGHFELAVKIVKHKRKHKRKHGRTYTYIYTYTVTRHERLPRVHYFEAWAEANLGVHLSPQWTLKHHKYVNTGADIYRGLLNSFYTGIKSGDPNATVTTSGLAPYGDPPGGARTPPVRFLRNVLCLTSRGKHEPCSESGAHFDVIASDPYEVGSPTTLAEVANDASAPDLDKLTSVVNQGLRAGTVLPRGHKQLWVTEFSYDSKPPNPQAISTATQARWLDEAFYVFWREHVSTAIWYLVRDQTGSFLTHYFSGVYFHNGRRKLSFTAYRFPFVVMRNPLALGTLKSGSGATHARPDGRTATIWGIAPVTGSVAVERKVGKHWKKLFSTHVRANHMFVRTIAADRTGDYRAIVDGQSSLTWKYS
jgi:hypothetical protein